MEAPGADTDSAPPPAASWVRLALVFYAGMLGVAWLGRVAWQGQSLLFASPEAALRGVRWGSDVGLGLVVGALGIALSLVFTRLSAAGDRRARALAAALGELRPRDCVALALASAVGEEALFRGALQPSLGLALASLAFAAMHFAPRRELRPWSLFAFGGGLALGLLFVATGNLVASVTAHATLNAVNLALLTRLYGERSRRNGGPLSRGLR
jgi:membrane protease YdiL (CAAX protease family)